PVIPADFIDSGHARRGPRRMNPVPHGPPVGPPLVAATNVETMRSVPRCRRTTGRGAALTITPVQLGGSVDCITTALALVFSQLVRVSVIGGTTDPHITTFHTAVDVVNLQGREGGRTAGPTPCQP